MQHVPGIRQFPQSGLRIIPLFTAVLFGLVTLPATSATAQSVRVHRWWEPYKADDVDGDHVLGFWKFDGGPDSWTEDSSSHRRKATVRGAVFAAAGRYGGCLQSDSGFPVSRQSHAVHVAPAEELSPAGPFTVEMWIRWRKPDEAERTMGPVLADCKYIPNDHRGWMWSLTAESGNTRQMCVELGLGDRSDRWYSDPVQWKLEQWYHVAFSYDARGQVSFYVNGSLAGSPVREFSGSITPSKRPLAIGDRLGSNYRGFPGWIDEVRICRGAGDFRPFVIEPRSSLVFVRHTPDTTVSLTVTNRTGANLKQVEVTTTLATLSAQHQTLPLSAQQATVVDMDYDSTLRPGEYAWNVQLRVSDWPQSGATYETSGHLPTTIVARPLPHRMPVVMWGIGGIEHVVREIPRLKEIGFTHCLGLKADYDRIWKEGADAQLDVQEKQQATAMLDEALRRDLRIIASLAPGRWLRTAEAGRPFLRVDRNGKPYARADISGLAPQVQQFCYDVGAVFGREFGHHPAFDAALLHTEVRGESQVSFRPEDVAAYRAFSGNDPPAVVTRKNGVDYHKLPGFPQDRVVPDDDPVLQYLRWFWQQGDGWNQLNTQLHKGLHDHVRRENFWTFYDPAVRAPAISGSGGDVDVLSHWTYTYPDPIRIGLCTDELFEMARANGKQQQVMKMTQIIWYRSQTAPSAQRPATDPSPWVDQDPDAAYITIAPQHLREALWWKLARPVQGIMYHGWQSLVPTESKSAYRLTNKNTRAVLQQLIRQVVEPLGPTLRQIPDAPSDVAMLESFTSEMFARRGTYGWNHSWAGDVYHILMYARLQPRVLFEESLLKDRLSGIRVLVMPDCDVLPRSVVDVVKAFQQQGGIVIGDEQTCPAIRPDYTMQRISRSGKADKDKSGLQHAAATLRQWLNGRYTWPADSTSEDVVVRRRRYRDTDYVFAVNDRREFGTYVGAYGRVMEDGLPSTAEITVRRAAGHVYNLRSGREEQTTNSNDALNWNVRLGPCDGGLWMITKRPIRQIDITVPETARKGQSAEIEIRITDGTSPVDAVVPIELHIVDPEGIDAEFSGYYGAAGGVLKRTVDFAPNDRPGLWRIHVVERASGKTADAYLRLQP